MRCLWCHELIPHDEVYCSEDCRREAYYEFNEDRDDYEDEPDEEEDKD